MADDKTIEVYDQSIDRYAELTQKQGDDPLLLAFIDCFSPGDYVLDLGCGPALASATMRAKGLKVDPIDASAQMVELANSRFDIGARQASFDTIDGTAVYDGVWANFSLLHVRTAELPGLLQALRRALRERGVFHLSMKTGSGERRDKLQRLYSYYSPEQLRVLLAGAGFAVDAEHSGADMGMAGRSGAMVGIALHCDTLSTRATGSAQAPAQPRRCRLSALGVGCAGL